MLSPDEVQACWHELRLMSRIELQQVKVRQQRERDEFLEEISADYITANKAAAVLGIPVDEVRTLCRMKILVGVKLAGVGWLLSQNSLARAAHIITGESSWDVAGELS